MKITSFEEFDIWNMAVDLLASIHKVISKSEFVKDYSFRDQIRRAALSISSNIAEGFERNNNNEFIRYLKIAKGSCGEVRSQLLAARKIGYIPFDECESIKISCIDLSKRIGSLIQYLSQKKREGSFSKK